MSKIQVTIKPRFSEFELDGIKLRAYPDGNLERYFPIGNKYYGPGWQQLVNACNDHGYVINRIGSRIYKRHRLIYKAFNSSWDITDPKQVIDHKDQNKANNSLSNLREAVVSQNNHNRTVQKNNKVGQKCIFAKNYWSKNCWYWVIQIGHDNGMRYERKFKGGDGPRPDPLPPVPQLVLNVRDREVRRLHGEFVCLD